MAGKGEEVETPRFDGLGVVSFGLTPTRGRTASSAPRLSVQRGSVPSYSFARLSTIKFLLITHMIGHFSHRFPSSPTLFRGFPSSSTLFRGFPPSSTLFHEFLSFPTPFPPFFRCGIYLCSCISVCITGVSSLRPEKTREKEEGE